MGIIKEFQSDLDNAAVRVVGEYRARLHAEAAKLCGDASEADDLVMRTFDAAFRDTSSYDATKGELYPWLVGVLRRIYAKTDRRLVNRGTTPVDPAVLQDLAGISEDTVDEILERSDHDALREAMNRLDPEYKKMLVMHYFGELPVKQIATVMNMPVGTVLWRLNIARKILARDLGEKLGKKPVAVLLAALLGIGTLFGAWVSPFGDWVAEKVFGNAPAVEAVSAQGVEDFSGNKQNETPQVSDKRQVADPQEQEGDETMNIKSAFTNTLAVAAVAAAGLGASAVTANGATDYWLAGDDGYASSSLNMTGSQIGGWATAQGGAKTSHVPAAGNVYHVGCNSDGARLVLRTPEQSRSYVFPGGMVMEGGLLCFKGPNNDAVTIAALTCKSPYLSVLNNSNTTGNGTFRGSCWTVEDGAVMYASENTAATIGITFSTKIVGAGTLKAENLKVEAAAKATVTYDGDLSEFVGRVEAVNAAGGEGQLTVRFTQGSALTAGPANLDAESVVVRNHATLSFGETVATHPNRGFQIDGAVINVDDGKVVVIPGPVVAPNGFTKTGGGTLQILDTPSVAKDKVVVQGGTVEYQLDMRVAMTDYRGPEDGESHACACTVTYPVSGYTVKWAWNDDLESFTHDVAESFVATGTYTNRCRVTREGYKTYTGEATVVIRPTLFVATTGDDAAAGRKDSPLLTITEAIERLGAAGGCVLLNDGTYMLEKKFDTYPYTATVDYTCGWCVQVCTPVEIIGLSHDPKKVILDARNAQCALMVMNHPDASIRYVTLQNAYADEKGTAGSYGGGNLRLDAGTVSDCIFRDGQTKGHGGNLWVSAGMWRVSRCVFYGGVNINNGGFTSSVFAIGDAANGIHPTLDNCFIFGAAAGATYSTVYNRFAVTARNGARFVNCTIAGSAASAAAAYLYDTSSRFVNCAIYDNGGKDGASESGVSWRDGFVCCATAKALSGGTNCKVVAEPKFKNAAAGNYRLQQGSPLIGAGDLAAYRGSAVSATDVAGNKRIRRNALSIGCYEYAPSGLIISFW